MQSLAERLAHAEREIAMALEESHRPHTEPEHIGILLWEMDWRMARESILSEIEEARTAGDCSLTLSARRLPPDSQRSAKQASMEDDFEGTTIASELISESHR